MLPFRASNSAARSLQDAAEPAKVKAKKGVAGKKPKKTAPKRSIKKPKRVREIALSANATTRSLRNNTR